MDGKSFRSWVSEIDALTEMQKAEAGDILAGGQIGGALIAAIELRVGAERVCPHCGVAGAVSRGRARGLRRYRCKGCGKSFNALTGTPLSGLHHKDRWLGFGQSLADGDTIATSSDRCGVAVSTAFRWRHRFLRAAKNGVVKLSGIVEADETFVLSSRKRRTEPGP